MKTEISKILVPNGLATSTTWSAPDAIRIKLLPTGELFFLARVSWKRVSYYFQRLGRFRLKDVLWKTRSERWNGRKLLSLNESTTCADATMGSSVPVHLARSCLPANHMNLGVALRLYALKNPHQPLNRRHFYE